MIKATIIKYPGEFNRHALARTVLDLAQKGFMYIASDNTDDEPIVLSNQEVEFSTMDVFYMKEDYELADDVPVTCETSLGLVDIYKLEELL
jgi:hypothetical protein